MEEAAARIAIDALLGVYNIPRISQVQLIYRASLVDGQFGVGPESLETRLFAWEEIPWADLAFPTVHWALKHWHETRDAARFVPFGNPPGLDADSL